MPTNSNSEPKSPPDENLPEDNARDMPARETEPVIHPSPETTDPALPAGEETVPFSPETPDASPELPPPPGEERPAFAAETALKEIAASISALEQKNDALLADFQSKIKYDSHKEKIIDTLHAELQSYKNDLLNNLLRPVFMDIIEVIDDTRKLLKDLGNRDAAEHPEQLKKIAANLPSDLEDLLYKHHVEVVASEATQFNPALQKVVKVVPTDVESLDKSICERLKNGYMLNGRLIRHEMVSVYQFQKKES